jgi:antitoxin (DNA-binding transcriptional repressor) of toxin-antitoxin stability system
LLESKAMKVTLEQVEKEAAEYLHRVIDGETVVVYSGDRPVAEIRPVTETETLRPVGLAAGEFVVPDDFDDPLPDELLDAFEGR